MVDPLLSQTHRPDPRFETERIVAGAEEDDTGGGRNTTGAGGGRRRRRPRATAREGSRGDAASASGHPDTEPAVDASVSEEELQHQVDRLNGLLGKHAQLACQVDRADRLPGVAVIDRRSGEVVKRFRFSEVPQLFARLRQGGLLVDNRS